MRTKILISLLILASLLAACSPTEAEQVSTPTTPPLTREEVSEIAAQAAADAVAGIKFPETVVEEPVVEDPAPVLTVKALSECSLKDKGIRLEFEGPNEGEFYLLSGLSEAYAAYEGCNFLFEGRQDLTEEHNIWVFYGLDWQLKVREGSLWVYPADWNMTDFSTEKSPIAAEFVTAKRHNQVANGYDWVIFVHDGENIYEFPAGKDTPIVVLPDNAQFSEPEPLAVQGIWNGQMFDASIGAENTVTVALLDGQLFYWANAQDNIVYKTVQAWIMPSGWSLDQIESWAGEKFPGQILVEYIG